MSDSMILMAYALVDTEDEHGNLIPGPGVTFLVEPCLSWVKLDPQITVLLSVIEEIIQKIIFLLRNFADVFFYCIKSLFNSSNIAQCACVAHY